MHCKRKNWINKVKNPTLGRGNKIYKDTEGVKYEDLFKIKYPGLSFLSPDFKFLPAPVLLPACCHSPSLAQLSVLPSSTLFSSLSSTWVHVKCRDACAAATQVEGDKQSLACLAFIWYSPSVPEAPLWSLGFPGTQSESLEEKCGLQYPPGGVLYLAICVSYPMPPGALSL